MGASRDRRGRPGRHTDKAHQRWQRRQEEERDRKARAAEVAAIHLQGHLEVWMEKEARVRRMTSALDEMARQVTPAEEALLRLGAVRVAVYIEETRAVVFLDTPKGRERELGVLSLPAGGPAAFHELFEAVAETGLRYETRGTGRLAEPWDLEDLEPV